MEEKLLFRSKRKVNVLPIAVFLICLVAIGLLVANSLTKSFDKVEWDVYVKAHDTAAFASIPLAIVAVASLLAHLSRAGYRFEITDKVLRGRGAFGKKILGVGRVSLEVIKGIQMTKSDVFILFFDGDVITFRGIRNTDELQEVIDSTLSDIFAENFEKYQEKEKKRQESVSQADLQRMISGYQAQLRDNVNKRAARQRAKSIAKGAIIGGFVAGNAGAVVGAAIAKDKLDNKGS